MKRGAFFRSLLCIAMIWLFSGPLEVRAEIAADNAFEGVSWEKIIEDSVEGSSGLVQSICATENYIICIENYSDGTFEPDIVKAYYRNKKDAQGNPVEQYSLAKRVAVQDYEHANGMAYNPNTKEIAVALYTNTNPENKGCIYIMEAETLEYKSWAKISDDYNILGIGYDTENDRYIIQTDASGGYSFKILDNQFQVIEDLGQYEGSAIGSNFQDLCVSGDYIINFPLTLGMGIGDHILMYSISRKALVSDSVLDFQFENVVTDEPESICELEPGVFASVVNVTYMDGTRNFCVYKTMVPYNFTAAKTEQSEDKEETEDAGAEEQEESGQAADTKKDGTKQNTGNTASAKSGFAHAAGTVFKTILKVFLMLVIAGAVFIGIYARIVAVRRERRRKLIQARRERERIRRLYEN